MDGRREAGDDAACAGDPPHDHDALLDQIQHYLMDHYQIEHATIQMEYQPVMAGQTAT